MHKSAQQLIDDQVKNDLLYEHEQVVGGDCDRPDFRYFKTDIERDEPVDPAQHVGQRPHFVCEKRLEGAVREKVVYLPKECLYDVKHGGHSFPTDVMPAVIFNSPTA